MREYIFDPEKKSRIDSMHERNKFKLQMYPMFDPHIVTSEED